MSNYQMLLADWTEQRDKIANSSNEVIITDENDEITVDGLLNRVRETCELPMTVDIS